MLELLRAVAKSTDNADLRQEILELGCAHRPLHPDLLRFGQALELGSIDFKEFAVLYVDDEERSLRVTAREYGRVLRIYTMPSAQDGLRLLQTRHAEIGVVFSDQSMPGAKGLPFLARVRELYPKPVRILVSTFARKVDWVAAQEAVRSGLIHSFVLKPWSPAHLEELLKNGVAIRLISNLVHDLGTIFAKS